MAFSALPKFQHSVYFLPPKIDPKFYKYTQYINSPPFERADSYEKAFEKIKSFDSNSILRNVRLSYCIESVSQDPKGNSFTSSKATSFEHPEVTAGKFLEILKCCDPANKNSLEMSQKCWNKVFPGSLSNFNLDVSSIDHLTPEVRDNFLKYYPPSKM
jgi:hypothetical protein